VYVFIVIPIISLLFKINLNKITEINKTKFSPLSKNILIFSFLSLGGLPPFLGFTAKLAAILASIKLIPLIILLILITSSLVSLFYYTKIFYNLSINTKYSFKASLTHKIIFKNKIILISSIGNFIISLIVLLT